MRWIGLVEASWKSRYPAIQLLSWSGLSRMRDKGIAHLGGSAYCEPGRQDQHARQRPVFAAEALEVLHRLYAHSFRHESVRGDIFDLKKVSRAKGLVLGQEQFAFAAHIGAQGGIEDKAPENVPVARLAVNRVLVDHPVVVIFRLAGSTILNAG